MAVGAAAGGLRPVVEIMFADFLANAFDQVVNHAAKLRYMSGGQLELPLVVRSAHGGGIGFAAQHSQAAATLAAAFPGHQDRRARRPRPTPSCCCRRRSATRTRCSSSSTRRSTRSRARFRPWARRPRRWASRSCAVPGATSRSWRWRAPCRRRSWQPSYSPTRASRARSSTCAGSCLWTKRRSSPRSRAPAACWWSRRNTARAAGRAASSRGWCSPRASSLTAAPRVISAPDVPIPYGPLEQAYQPSAEAIADAARALAGEGGA